MKILQVIIIIIISKILDISNILEFSGDISNILEFGGDISNILEFEEISLTF